MLLTGTSPPKGVHFIGGVYSGERYAPTPFCGTITVIVIIMPTSLQGNISFFWPRSHNTELQCVI